MKQVRFWIAVLALALLTLGYAGSQYFALALGRPDQWTKIAESPLIVAGSMILLLLAIGFALKPDQEDESKP